MNRLLFTAMILYRRKQTLIHDFNMADVFVTAGQLAHSSPMKKTPEFITQLPSNLAQAATLVLCILEVYGSNLSRTDFPMVFLWLFSCSSRKI
jgi:hypothetical protein